MVAAREHLPRLTPEEYFAWEEQQEVKHEYFEGEVFAMSGGTQNHSRVGGRLFSLIDLHLDNSECVVLTSDARVKIQESEKADASRAVARRMEAHQAYVYPDVSTCDARDRDTPQFITHPCLIVEVLSPSTEAYDRGDKFELYRRSTSLREYALVSADKIAIDLHRKDDLNRWQSIYFRAGDTVELESINLTFPIERIYRGIEF